MLAAIGRHFGWSRAELEALTGVEMRFWVGTINRYHEHLKGVV
jgi:hypothetical protein